MARESQERSGWVGSALRVGALYLLFGAAWILVTDTLLPRAVQDIQVWQTYKGLLFVALSAALISALVYRELSARRRAESRLAASERRYRAMFERGVAGVFRSTAEGEILECNPALARILGLDRPEEVVGTDAGSYYAEPEQRDEWIDALRREGRVRNHELHLQRPDGTDVWTLMNATFLEDGEEGERVVAGTMVDVTQEKQLRDQLEAYAYHDSLTGLPNRRYLVEEAGDVISKARRDEEAVGLLYVDLDRFKRINDTLGHDVGDEVLFEVGRRLEMRIREEDVVARIGGDEFAVLLNTVDDLDGARAAARRLREGMERPFFTGTRSVHVDVTVGIAMFPDHGGEFHELLSRADRAMARARSGATGVAVTEAVEQRVRRDRLMEEEELREAIRQNQLELHYQPVYRVADGRPVGAEALVRWRHPDLGIRSPGEFIPIAERTGLIREVDGWVVGAAAADAERFAGNGRLEWLSVNVSAQSLQHEGVFRDLLASLGEPSLAGRRLVVEITESGAMQDPRATADLFRELQDRGARVAIDDFGTGHSALAYLKDLPTDLVKLDMIFVRGIDESEREDRLLRALIELGRTLDVDVVAEGVETEGQYRRLGEHGCHLAQGYYLGRPVPADELTDAL